MAKTLPKSRVKTMLNIKPIFMLACRVFEVK